MATRSSNHRRCCRPFSRGTLLVLVWNLLLTAAFWFVVNYSLYLALPSELKFSFERAAVALTLLLPVIGWVADAWLGRYRAIIVGIFLLMVTTLTLQVAFIMLQLKWTPIPGLALICITLLISTVGYGSLKTSLLPFTLDQMIGESAEELGAAVHWYWWGYTIGPITITSIQCIPISNCNTPQLQDFLPTIFLALGSLSLAAVLISDCFFHKWLDPHFKTNNPIKLIFCVLNYARKNKYPRYRSAFTYLDEEHPSRLDFGKDKFGGPFTEEEVEDVKTMLRLIPLLMTVAGVYLCLDFNGSFHLHVIPTTILTRDCVAGLQQFVYYLTSVLLIPAYRFILYPVFYNYIPSMMKRIGAGLFLLLVSTLLNLTLDIVGHLHSNTTHCMFDTDTGSTDTLPIPPYWLLMTDVVGGVGFAIVMCFSFEFFMAQTPNRMRGFMMGLLVFLFNLAVTTEPVLGLIFQHFQAATPSCGFYYYLVLSFLILLILILFVILAKCYKLRERDRHVNIQAIAEEHYERYLDQEEEYMTEEVDRYNLPVTIVS